MRYLVTGGGGFIGAYTVHELIKRGHEPFVYDSHLHGNTLSLLLDSRMLSEAQIISGSISDFHRLLGAVKDNRIEKIIHIASPLDPVTEPFPSVAVKDICLAMVNVLEAARLCEIGRVVWASSVAVFGPVGYYEGPVTDSSVHLPQNVYGASKSYAEFLARHYYEQFRVDSVGLRYMFVYGAGRLRGNGMFWSHLIDSSLRGCPFESPCGDEIYTWQYVEDAAELTVLASESGKFEGRSVNCPGDYQSMWYMADCVKDLIPSAQINLLPGRTNIDWNCQAEAVENELGFKPRFNVKAGVSRSIELMRHQRAEGTFQAAFGL